MRGVTGFLIGVIYDGGNPNAIHWVRFDPVSERYFVGARCNATEFADLDASLRKIKRSWVGDWYDNQFVIEKQTVTVERIEYGKT